MGEFCIGVEDYVVAKLSGGMGGWEVVLVRFR